MFVRTRSLSMGSGRSTPRVENVYGAEPLTIAALLAHEPAPAAIVPAELVHGDMEALLELHVATEHEDVENPDWLCTGDIIAFRGLGWRARFIQLITLSQYSHVGMVHRVVDPDTGVSVLCLLECTNQRDCLKCLLRDDAAPEPPAGAGGGLLLPPPAAPQLLGAMAHAGDPAQGRVRLVQLEARLRDYVADAVARGHTHANICVIKTEVRRPTRGVPVDAVSVRVQMGEALSTFAMRRECGRPYGLGGHTCVSLVAHAMETVGIIRPGCAQLLISPRQLMDRSLTYACDGDRVRLARRNLHWKIVA